MPDVKDFIRYCSNILLQSMDNLDSSSSSEKTYSSSDDENENPGHGESKVKEPKQKSRQLRYYQRKNEGKMKRKYTPFRDQKNPSRLLKKYHKDVEAACSTLPVSLMDTAESVEIMSDTDINEEMKIGMTEEIQDVQNVISSDNFEDEAALNTTSSSEEESETSSSASEDRFSQSEQEEMEGMGREPENLNKTALRDEEMPLYQGSAISKILSCVLVVSFVLKHNLSAAALADLLRLLTTFLGDQCRQTFQSVYKMKLIMKEYFGSKEPTKINYCTNCLQAVEDKCPNTKCSKAGMLSFLDLHLEEKIKDLFRDSEFMNLLKKGKGQVKRAASCSRIYDIYHGLDYKNFIHPGGFLSQLYNISFTVNTDGVNKYSSSRAGHLWPVYIMINELPKEYRFKRKFIIPAYIYCDKHDPNMLTFLNPLIEKLNVLNSTGIHVSDSADGDINVRCMLFLATADLPARADLMNMKRFNGKCACHLCKSEGVGYGPNNINRYWPFEQSPIKRTHEDQLKFASKATIKQAVMGVKGHSIFAKLSYPFDLVRSFAIDWMHSICLEVVKYIMHLQKSDGNKDKVFLVGAKTLSMSHKLLSIKPPDIVGRLPRSLEDLKHWKATELKNWLLHYSVPVLYKILNPLYIFHWSLLVGATGILCSDSISNTDLKEADGML